MRTTSACVLLPLVSVFGLRLDALAQDNPAAPRSVSANTIELPSQEVLSRVVENAGGGIHWIRDPYRRYDLRRRGGKIQPAQKVVDRGLLLDRALQRARAEKKLVLVHVPRIEGRPMYRAPVLDDYMRLSLWSDPDTIALVNRRFVPLRLYADTSVAKRLGIGNATATDEAYLVALEPAVFFVTPEGHVVHRVDRIRTFSASWFRALALKVLRANTKHATPSLQTELALRQIEVADKAANVRVGGAVEDPRIGRQLWLAEQLALDGSYDAARNILQVLGSKIAAFGEDTLRATRELKEKRPTNDAPEYRAWSRRLRAQQSQFGRFLRASVGRLLSSARVDRLRRDPRAALVLLNQARADSAMSTHLESHEDYWLERARCHIALGDFTSAEKALDGAGKRPEACWLRGACKWRRSEYAGADESFARTLAMATSPWSDRAAGMLAYSDDTTRRSPLAHGFEMLEEPTARAVAGKPATTTELRRNGDAASAMQHVAKDALRYLLASQAPDGSWSDARYAYWPSPEILPNVRVAVTALASTALLSWRSLDPDRVDAALLKSEKYLRDDNRVALGTEEEVYSQSYRILYWTRRVAAKWGSGDDPVVNLAALVKRASAIQDKDSGFFAHEYKNAFCTGSIMWALYQVKKAGITVDDDIIQLGLSALRAARRDDGSFAYGGTAKQRDANRPPSESITRLKDSSARMPVCEAVLHAFGSSDEKKLAHAFDTFLTYLDRIARVRKTDFHSDGELAGFFFWHALFHASEAMVLCDDAQRVRVRNRLRELTTTIQEIDGSYIDSHELGKSYGTAMALLTLGNLR